MGSKISSANKDPFNGEKIDISAMSFEDFVRYTFGDLEKLEESIQLDQFDQLVENALDKLVSSQYAGERETDDLVGSKPEGSSSFHDQHSQDIPSQSNEMIQHKLRKNRAKSIIEVTEAFKGNMCKIAEVVLDKNIKLQQSSQTKNETHRGLSDVDSKSSDNQRHNDGNKGSGSLFEEPSAKPMFIPHMSTCQTDSDSLELSPAFSKALRVALKRIATEFNNALKEIQASLQENWSEGLQEAAYLLSHEKRRKATHVLKQLTKKCGMIRKIIENRKAIIEAIIENDHLALPKEYRKKVEEKVKELNEKLQKILLITAESPSLFNLTGRRKKIEAHRNLEQLVEESTKMRKMLACPEDEQISVLQLILPRQEIYDDIKRLFRAHSTFGDRISHALDLDYADEQSRNDKNNYILDDFEEKQKIIKKVIYDQIKNANRYFECRNKLQPESNSKQEEKKP